MNNAKSSNYVAIAMMAVGFLLIVLGWNGAASYDTTQQQLPYIISGGLAGIALIASGLTLMVVMELRRNSATLEARLIALTDTLESMRSTPSGDVGGMAGLSDRQRRALERAGGN